VSTIVAGTNYTYNRIRSLGVNTKLVKIPNGVAKAFFQKKELIETPTLLFTGRWTRDKRIQDIISALPTILKEVPDCRLCIVGRDDSYGTELKKLARELGVRQQIVFEENISFNRLLALHKKSHLFIFPSVYEGFGQSPIEAMASGTPVLIRSSRMTAHLIKDGVQGFFFRDSRELAEKAIRILKNDSVWKEMSDNAMQNAQKHRWDRIVKEYLKVYSDLTQRE
jgi:1,2-diacylglycerol 3-alpha-glucosyltransferase